MENRGKDDPGRFGVPIVTGMLLVFAILYLSKRLPYFPGDVVWTELHWAIPIIIFVICLCAYAWVGSDGSVFSRMYSGEGWLAIARSLVPVAVLSIGCGWIFEPVPAYPSKWFADKKFEALAMVEHKNTYARYNTDLNALEVHLNQEKGTVTFSWPISLASQIHRGGCIAISGRTWALGTYVEDVHPVPCH